MNMKNDMNRKYIKAFSPDMAELAACVNRAKGEYRTMAEFAKACDQASPSTFSRIINGNIKKPLSAELIKAIIENSADPELTYYEMMSANGMIPEDEKGGRSIKEPIFEKEEHDRLVKNIIMDELLARDCTIRLFVPQEELAKSAFAITTVCNFAFKIDSNGYGPENWCFLSYLPARKMLKNENNIEERKYITMKRIMYYWWDMFLCDAWEPDIFKDTRNSIIFTDEESYSTFCERIMKIKVNNFISMIFVDMDKQIVVEEKFIPRNDGKEIPSIFEKEKKSLIYDVQE